MKYCNVCDRLIVENKSCPYCTNVDNSLMVDNIEGAALSRARQVLGIGAGDYDRVCNRDDCAHQLQQGTLKHSVSKSLLQPFTERYRIMRNS